MVEANSFVTPFQGWADFRCLYPGRCPGLVCFGLSGQESAIADFLRDKLVPACQPVFLSFGETQVTNSLSILIALFIHTEIG